LPDRDPDKFVASPDHFSEILGIHGGPTFLPPGYEAGRELPHLGNRPGVARNAVKYREACQVNVRYRTMISQPPAERDLRTALFLIFGSICAVSAIPTGAAADSQLSRLSVPVLRCGLFV